MYVYANNFTFAVSDNKSECMLSFRQIHPLIDEQGIVKGNTVEPVAEVVLTREGLIALKSLLNDPNLAEK